MNIKKGFTLIELAIVLVIIGLLVGGILAAQSMIETAGINSQIRQLTQYQTAVANFRTNYKSLPGDTQFFSPAGDGDNIIESASMQNGSTTFINEFSYEASNFWPHLQQAGLSTPFTFSNDASSGIRTGVNIPKAVLGKGLYRGGPAGVKLGGTITSKMPTALFLYVCDWTRSNNVDDTPETNRSSVLTPFQSLAIDKKVDDGLPFNGIVLANGKNDNLSAPDGTKCRTDSTTNAYLNNSNIECCIQYSIMNYAY